MTMQEKIAAMQTKRQPHQARPDMWQNDDGTWSHKHDKAVKWQNKEGCAMDLRFSRDWYRGRA